MEELVIQEEQRQAGIEEVLLAGDEALTIEQQGKLEEANWIAGEQAKDPSQTVDFLKNKWKDINKYDSSTDSAKVIGEAVDGVIDSGVSTSDGFEQVVGIAGNNIDEAYKGFKSRLGTAMADKPKSEYLSARGYDEESINQDAYANLVSDIYSGEETNALALARLVKEGESLGLPEEVIMSQLEVIADSPNADVNTKIMAETYLKTMQPDRDIRSIDGALVEITPDAVKELYKSEGDVDEGILIENASREEQRSVTQIMRQLPTKLKDSPIEVAARQNEILADIRDGRDVQDILDEMNGFLILDDEDLGFAKGLRVLATGSDASLGDISAAINLGDFLQPILTVENAKMGKYDQSDFNQAQTAAIVNKADEVVDLIELVGQGFMGKVDNRLFNADKAIRNRAIIDGGIEEGDEAFAAATQLGSIMARLMAVERKSFGGTAITDTELEALAPMLADMKDQPASAAIKIAELANAALDQHNFYRQKEGLPVFTNPDQILNDEDKEELYRDYIGDRFPSEAKIDPVGTGESNTVDLIKAEEGFRQEAYLDSAGIPTIGYGFTSIDGKEVEMGDTITQEVADIEINKQIAKHSNYKEAVTVELTDTQEQALASFEYNLGAGIWNTTGKEIIEAINQGDTREAARIMALHDKARNPDTGELQVVRGLSNRRGREVALLTQTQ